MDQELTLDRYVGRIWHGKWLVIALALVAAATAWVVETRQPAAFTSAGLIEPGRINRQPIEDPFVTAEIANSSGFLQDLAGKLGVRPALLARSARISAVLGGPRRAEYPILIRVEATADDEQQSMVFASAVAEEIVARHAGLFDAAIAPRLERQMRLDQAVKSPLATPEMTARFESERDELRSELASTSVTQKTRLVSPVVATRTSRPSPWRTVATAALIAGLAGIAAALILPGFRKAGRVAGRDDQGS